MGAESGMNSSVRDDRVALSDGAKALWGKTNRIDDSEWLPLYVHMVDSAAMASKIWDTWVPQGTKAVIVGDLGNDEVLARKLMIFILEQLRARNASNTHHINHTANSEMSCEKGTAEKLRLISNAYPLLTYTDGHETKHADVKPSGRSMKVQCRLVDDDDTALLDLMDALLVDGGCIGVICDTVGRAQHAAELLGNHCGRDCVRLTHSRFMDIDRMSNERELRDLLGPDATIGNGKRPGKLVVVGTQVLEQSLDIDFDALVTDIAPVDLIMQRLGRVHRHRRGDGECDRPVSLQTATCYIRGVEAWNNEGPKFSRGADSVYDAAALMESLAVYSARNEQHMAFKVYGADWSPVDCDGLQLIKRPKEAKEGSFVGTPRKGWSNASKYRKARKFSKRN